MFAQAALLIPLQMLPFRHILVAWPFLDIYQYCPKLPILSTVNPFCLHSLLQDHLGLPALCASLPPQYAALTLSSVFA